MLSAEGGLTERQGGTIAFLGLKSYGLSGLSRSRAKASQSRSTIGSSARLTKPYMEEAGQSRAEAEPSCPNSHIFKPVTSHTGVNSNLQQHYHGPSTQNEEMFAQGTLSQIRPVLTPTSSPSVSDMPIMQHGAG